MPFSINPFLIGVLAMFALFMVTVAYGLWYTFGMEVHRSEH